MSIFNSSSTFSIGGKKYKLNLEALLEIKDYFKEDKVKEYEITQVYNTNEMDLLNLSSKVEHETKHNAGTNNEILIYELIKIMIMRLIESTTNTKGFEPDLGETLSFNTLLSWGILTEIK